MRLNRGMDTSTGSLRPGDDGKWHLDDDGGGGPYAESGTVDLALHVLDEVIHHGAEVGLLRDLYSHRSTLRG